MMVRLLTAPSPIGIQRPQSLFHPGRQPFRSHTTTTQRDPHLAAIAEHGRIATDSGSNRRSFLQPHGRALLGCDDDGPGLHGSIVSAEPMPGRHLSGTNAALKLTTPSGDQPFFRTFTTALRMVMSSIRLSTRGRRSVEPTSSTSVLTKPTMPASWDTIRRQKLPGCGSSCRGGS